MQFLWYFLPQYNQCGSNQGGIKKCQIWAFEANGQFYKSRDNQITKIMCETFSSFKTDKFVWSDSLYLQQLRNSQFYSIELVISSQLLLLKYINTLSSNLLNLRKTSHWDQIKAFLQHSNISQQNQLLRMINMSLATPQEIQRHCMNNSPAKICYRFPQSKRFQQTNPQCPVAFYTYNSQLSKKKTVIGTSKKIEYNAVLTQTPSGTDYNPNSYHEFTKHRGKTFGSSREKNPAYLVPQIHIHPGPATYKAEKQKNQSSSFTMRAKTIDVIQKHKTYKKNPGPGDYQSGNLIRDKKDLLISRFKGPQLGVICRSGRFGSIKASPGAQDYQKIDDLSADGKYIVSTHKGKGTRSFTHQQRFTHQHWKATQNPGPAEYIKPSDFGIYGHTGLKSHQSNAL